MVRAPRQPSQLSYRFEYTWGEGEDQSSIFSNAKKRGENWRAASNSEIKGKYSINDDDRKDKCQSVYKIRRDEAHIFLFKFGQILRTGGPYDIQVFHRLKADCLQAVRQKENAGQYIPTNLSSGPVFQLSAFFKKKLFENNGVAKHKKLLFFCKL